MNYFVLEERENRTDFPNGCSVCMGCGNNNKAYWNEGTPGGTTVSGVTSSFTVVTTSAWHPANDFLTGSESYGTYIKNGHTHASTFSKSFENISFTKFLFSTGDMSEYVIIDKSAIVENTSRESNEGF